MTLTFDATWQTTWPHSITLLDLAGALQCESKVILDVKPELREAGVILIRLNGLPGDGDDRADGSDHTAGDGGA